MKLSLDSSDASYIIKGYSSMGVQINDTIYSRSLVISPEKLDDQWRPGEVSDLVSADIAHLENFDAEIVILGTGRELTFPDMQLLMPLYSKGLGVEVMDTNAACRTYNVLVSEKRKVVAGLILT